MKKRHLVLLVLSAMLLGVTSGCGVNVEIHSLEDVSPELSDGYIDIAPEMAALADLPAMFSIPMPEASGTDVISNTKAEIDISNVTDGYVMIRYKEKTQKALRTVITGPSGTSYQYVLKSGGEYEVFPLSDGNGSYTIGVYENISGTSYSTSLSAAIQVVLTDEFAPFLRPNQYVNYSPDSKTVKKAAELIKKSGGLLDSVSAIYSYVIDNITYDKELAASVKSGYLPDVDKVLEKGKGICFDYAAVMAAMLRSQGVPAKLVVGYTGSVYHAWISVYSSETGWIESVIYFDGESWKLMDPTFASSGKQSDQVMKYIGDGTNYKAKYLY